MVLKAKETAEGGFSMSAQDQLTMDDYVYPYVDDSDTEDDELNTRFP